MRRRTFLQSLNDAVEGFIYVVRHERNMRFHFFVAFFVLMFALFIGVRSVDWIILCTTITLVLVAEMVNTAIEETVDVIFKGLISQNARIIKHISAGIVLVTACNALIVAFVILSKYISSPFNAVTVRLRYAPWYVLFMALVVVMFIVIAGKAFTKKGTPFRGGAISGHSAVAFALWTTVLFTQSNMFVISVTFCIAALVAQSRLRAKIHSLVEVMAGACVGILVMGIFFRMLIAFEIIR